MGLFHIIKFPGFLTSKSHTCAITYFVALFAFFNISRIAVIAKAVIQWRSPCPAAAVAQSVSSLVR